MDWDEQEAMIGEQIERDMPYTVGRVATAEVIARFKTAKDAEDYMAEVFDAEDVARGVYFIDGPEA